MRCVHAFGDDALGGDDAVGLAARLRAGEVSAAELVEAAIGRCDAVDAVLGAVAHRDADRARRRAAAYRPRSFFAGVPTFLKDNVDVAGWPTRDGTDAWHPVPAERDGDLARLFAATGLIPLGKTQLSEFGFSAAAEHPRLGAVRNPWHTDRTAGASSSGAGALVAAGVVPLAHANDGGGSIRIPAACNGLVGLKPTRDRLPVDAVMRAMPIRIVANGVLTRTVRDTAAFLREAERARPHRGLAPIGDVRGPGRRRLRIAVITRSVRRDSAPAVRGATLGTAARLAAAGHDVELLERPPVPGSFADDFVLYWGLLAMALVRTGRRRFGPSFDRTRLDNLTRGLDRHAARHLHRLPAALTRLARTRRHTEALFADHDVVLTPTLADTTPPVGHFDPMQDYRVVVDRLVDWVAFTPLHNITGEPAVSVPAGHDPDGMPLSVMLSAPVGGEATLLEVAYELEALAPWPRVDGGAITARPQRPAR